MSQKQIKKFLGEGNATINSKRASPHDWVDHEDRLELHDKPLSVLAPNGDVDCRLIKKTTDYIFFEKGPLVHSVAQGYGETQTAANWLLSIDSGLNTVSHPLESGLLHRLDHETSGVMVAARHQKSYQYLKRLFATHAIIKEYHCLVSKEPPPAGLYTDYSGQKSKNSKKVFLQHRVLTGLTKICTEILSVGQTGVDCYAVRLKLITGSRHQIRAHLAFLGSPVMGDTLYGGVCAERLMLHASRLSFITAEGKTLMGTAKVPF
ncbi:MAG: hypothetical protein HQM16_17535 [Deltaproteobacteria bacterium]|nr:hypothetical protein [Deltaproteobacteria bacterium]